MPQRMNYARHAQDLIAMLREMGQNLKKGSLEITLLNLVVMRASQINRCTFCVDMHAKEAKIDEERELRLHHLAVWEESPLFTDREKAALEWTEALTRLSETRITDDLFDRVHKVFSEKELTDLTGMIGIINVWNRFSVGFGTVPGSLDAFYGLDKAGLS
jgi:AhpD family alkylhydroperoxidase